VTADTATIVGSDSNLRERKIHVRSRSNFAAWAVAVIAVATLATGCEGSQAATVLTIDVTQAPATTLTLRLRCSPLGGSVRNAQKLCRILSAHRNMVFPSQATGTCLGSFGIPPEVRVYGTFRGRPVRLAVRSCDEPPARAEAAALWLDGLELKSCGAPRP
jgi:hypothetical protein